MKSSHLLLTCIIIPSTISGMKIERSSSITKKTLTEWVYREKTKIIITDHINDTHDTPIELTDQNSIFNIETNEAQPKKSSSKENKLTKQFSFERH